MDLLIFVEKLLVERKSKPDFFSWVHNTKSGFTTPFIIIALLSLRAKRSNRLVSAIASLRSQ